MDKLRPLQKDYQLYGKKIHIAYLQTPDFTSLYQQYKNGDSVLARIFLALLPQEMKLLKRYPCFALKPLSNPAKSQSALGMILQSAGISLHYPIMSDRGVPEFSWHQKLLLEKYPKTLQRNSRHSQVRKNFDPSRNDPLSRKHPHQNAKVQPSLSTAKAIGKRSRHKIPLQLQHPKPYIVVCEELPSREDFLYHPVLVQAKSVWILSGPKNWKSLLEEKGFVSRKRSKFKRRLKNRSTGFRETEGCRRSIRS